jgi:hypothetical protein
MSEGTSVSPPRESDLSFTAQQRRRSILPVAPASRPRPKKALADAGKGRIRRRKAVAVGVLGAISICVVLVFCRPSLVAPIGTAAAVLTFGLPLAWRLWNVEQDVGR